VKLLPEWLRESYTDEAVTQPLAILEHRLDFEQGSLKVGKLQHRLSRVEHGQRLEEMRDSMSPEMRQQMTEWNVDTDFSYDKVRSLKFKLLNPPRMTRNQQVIADRIKYGLPLGLYGSDGRCGRCLKELTGRAETLDHVAACKHGGFPIVSHNDIVDVVANTARKCGITVSKEDRHVIQHVKPVNKDLSRKKPFDFWLHSGTDLAGDVSITASNVLVNRAEKAKIAKYIAKDDGRPKLKGMVATPSTKLLHIPGTPEGVRWAPMVISRHGQWGVFATVIAQLISVQILE